MFLNWVFIMKVKEIITEAPYLNHEELPYKAISSISVNRLKQMYTKIGEVKAGVDVYQHQNGSVIAGKIVADDFILAVSVSTRGQPYPIEPTLIDNVLQVSMVNVVKGEEDKGLTKSVYNVIGSLVDLVSDHEQYLGAKGLWKSLARSSDVNVYVFDGNKKDYVRNKNGQIVKYNGNNISDTTIWGSEIEFKTILLVATKKDLNNGQRS
jgi:hypothetical protein